jgi:hypothetical protein
VFVMTGIKHVYAKGLCESANRECARERILLSIRKMGWRRGLALRTKDAGVPRLPPLAIFQQIFIETLPKHRSVAWIVDCLRYFQITDHSPPSALASTPSPIKRPASAISERNHFC